MEYRADTEKHIELGQAKQRCIFAMLAVSANEVVMPDELIDRTWGAEPPQSARNMVHSYISRLRGVLENTGGGPGTTLRRRHGGYVLEVEADAVDLHRFRRTVARARATGTDTRTAVRLFREALGIWRGRPLGGITGEWAERTRRLLERERLSALVECHEGELRLGGRAELLDELYALADQHPDNELVVRNLMTGLHGLGRRAEAIEAYEALRRRLADRLGVDPAQQTRALHARILRADPGRDTAGPSVDAAPTVPRQLPRGIRCVGREQELAMFDGSVTAADGRPVIRVVEGPAGIGRRPWRSSGRTGWRTASRTGRSSWTCTAAAAAYGRRAPSWWRARPLRRCVPSRAGGSARWCRSGSGSPRGTTCCASCCAASG
ncbi:AfsR/SARP family transcriptional regulator [Streptomyces cellulosae]